MTSHKGYIVLSIVASFLATTSLIVASDDAECADNQEIKYQSKWPNHGGDLCNRRYAWHETKISPKTAPNLKLKWKFENQSFASATPALYEGTIYIPSFDGNVYAIKQSDGSVVWKQNLYNLTGLNTTVAVFNGVPVFSRATPTIAGDLVIFGMYGPSAVLALKRATGELVWTTRLEMHPDSIITMSGTYYDGAYYVGTSSLEELASIENCCTYRGSFAKLEAKTGKIIWKTYMLPDNHGILGEYAGAAIWGSSPSIDVSRNLVYIATGNLYSAPERIEACQERENNQTIPTHPEECIEPDNHSESFLALELDTGNIKWYHQLGGYDVWFGQCNNLSTPNCPPGPNPDADFGEAPMLLSAKMEGYGRRDIVVAVQKSGIAWALDRDNGDIVWRTEAGPGGQRGGGMWGAATDGQRVYTNIANSEAKNFTLKPSNVTTTTGGWVAIDPQGGEILWTIANPSNGKSFGPVTTANGVVFVGSFDNKGNIYAIDANSGGLLWSYETGAEVYSGVSVGDGCVYVAHGYGRSVKSLFAFCI